jgi:hypothetical protein
MPPKPVLKVFVLLRKLMRVMQTFFVCKKPKEKNLILPLLGNLLQEDLIILIIAPLLLLLGVFCFVGPPIISLLSLLRNNILPSRLPSPRPITSCLRLWWWFMDPADSLLETVLSNGSITYKLMMMTYGYSWEILIFTDSLKIETNHVVITIIVLCLTILSAIWVLLSCPLRVEATPGAICKILLFWSRLTGFSLMLLGLLSSP